MTKKELYTQITKELSGVLSQSKVSKTVANKIQAIIDEYLKPKASGGNVINPPFELDGITYYFDRYHQIYYPQDRMVMVRSKSKGYSKASIAHWNKMNREIKKLEAKATQYLLDGKNEEAQKFALEAKELKEKLNLPSTYNVQEDWTNFDNSKVEVKTIEIEGVGKVKVAQFK